GVLWGDTFPAKWNKSLHGGPSRMVERTTMTDLTHFNANTQGDGPFKRRDIVRLTSVRHDRTDVQWMSKRIGQSGQVSAVFDKYKMCMVLFPDGYWLNIHFD